MSRKITTFAAMAAALPLAVACATDGNNETAGGGVNGGATASAGTTSGGSTTGGTSGGTSGGGASTGGGSGGGLSIPSLINVNLQNVLNDLAIRLNIDRANIPENAQIPINVAANVCGVSINILSVSTGGQAACTAKTASNELAQSVQQQISAGGSVGGGAQGGSTVSTGSTTAGGGAGTSGVTGTTATSSGGSPTTTTQPQPSTPN